MVKLIVLSYLLQHSHQIAKADSANWENYQGNCFRKNMMLVPMMPTNFFVNHCLVGLRKFNPTIGEGSRRQTSFDRSLGYLIWKLSSK